jgi:hypothetical protein
MKFTSLKLKLIGVVALAIVFAFSSALSGVTLATADTSAESSHDSSATLPSTPSTSDSADQAPEPDVASVEGDGLGVDSLGNAEDADPAPETPSTPEDLEAQLEERAEADRAELADTLAEPAQTFSGVTPLTTPFSPLDAPQTDGAVTLSVPEYDPGAGVHFLHSMQASVTVDFTDAGVTDKTVVITAAPGMRFGAYPVIGSPHNIQVPANEVLSSVMTSFEVPTFSDWHTYNGALTYHFSDATTSVTIPFIIAPDEIAFYGQIDLNNAISAQGFENNGSEVSIGNAQKNIKITGTADWGTSGIFDGWAGIHMSSDNTIKVGLDCYNAGEIYQRGHYFKSITFDYYYPAGFVIQSTNQAGNITLNDPVNQHITFTVSAVASNGCFPSGGEPYIILAPDPLNMPPFDVDISASNPSTITFRHYDNMERISWPSITSSIRVVDPSTVVNAPAYFAADSGNPYYDFGDGYQQWLAGANLFNDNITVKTNQWVSVEIPSEIFASRVVLPFDESLQTAITEGWYQSTANPGVWTQIPAGAIGYEGYWYGQGAGASHAAGVTNTSLGLDADVGISAVKWKIGNISKNWRSYASRHTQLAGTAIIGKLNAGQDSAVVTYTAFASSDTGSNPTPDAGTLLTSTATVVRAAKPNVAVRGQVPEMTINAGETKTQAVHLNSLYAYAAQQAMKNPTFYVRIPNGIIYSNPQISDGSGYPTSATMSTPYITSTGARFVKIETQSHYGAYWDGSVISWVTLTFDITATQNAPTGVFNWTNFIFLKDDASDLTQEYNSMPVLRTNSYDVDGDGDLSKNLVAFPTQNYIVNSADSLNIDTYLLSNGGIREPAFNAANPDSAVNFSPGGQIEYKVDMSNNSIYPANDVVAYLPIPKTGLNFGTNFQPAPFKWDATLDGSVNFQVFDSSNNDITASVAANYSIECAVITSGNEANYVSASYSSTCDQNSSMIRITNTTGIAPFNRAHFSIPLEVAENAASLITAPEKLGTLNTFNPRYTFMSNGTGATLSGTLVGLRLVNGEIKGRVFKDANHNGIMDAGETASGDTEIEGKTVYLFKKQADSSYTQVDSTTTGTGVDAGKYEFTGLLSGEYYVDFTDVIGGATDKKFTHIMMGDDFEVYSSANCHGMNEGLALDINPTDESANFVNAGIIDYEAPSVSIDCAGPLKVANAQHSAEQCVTSKTITPVYFDSVAASTNPRVFDSSDDTVATVGPNGTITAVSPGTATITFTVTDMYGGTDSATCIVTVLSNDIPVLSGGNDITLRIGEDAVPVATWTNISITDTEDTGGTPEDVATYNAAHTGTNHATILRQSVPIDSVTGFVKTPGVYDINYSIRDVDGNVAHLTKHVYVVQPPYTWVILADDIQKHSDELDGYTDDDLIAEANVKIFDVADPDNPVEATLDDVNNHAEVTPSPATLEHVTLMPTSLGTHTMRFELVKNTLSRARIVMAAGEFNLHVYGDAIEPPTPPANCSDPANASLPECLPSTGGESGGYCSDPAHTTESACVSGGGIWTPEGDNAPGDLASTGMTSPLPVLVLTFIIFTLGLALLRRHRW